jgi:hypothetical protein
MKTYILYTLIKVDALAFARTTMLVPLMETPKASDLPPPPPKLESLWGKDRGGPDI